MGWIYFLPFESRLNLITILVCQDSYLNLIPLPNLTVYGLNNTTFSPPKFENAYKSDISLDIHSNKIRDYIKWNSSNRKLLFYFFLPAVSLQLVAKWNVFLADLSKIYCYKQVNEFLYHVKQKNQKVSIEHRPIFIPLRRNNIGLCLREYTINWSRFTSFPSGD